MTENVLKGALSLIETPEFMKSLIIVLVGLIGYLAYVRIARSWVGSFLRKAVANSRATGRREKQIQVWILLFERIGGFLILGIVAVSLIAEWGFNIAPILTGAGIVGLAFGLGSQNVMKDLISGVFIFLEGSYNEGDKVKLAGLSGEVKRMTLRKTVLISTEDDSIHIIPNSEIKTISIFKEGLERKKSKKKK